MAVNCFARTMQSWKDNPRQDRWTDLRPEDREFLDEFGITSRELQVQHEGCPPIDQVMAAHAGLLSPDAWPGVHEHLATCEWCRALVHDLADPEVATPNEEEAARIRQRVLRGERQRGFLSNFWRQPAYSVVLALLLIAVVGVVLNRTRQRTAPAAIPLPQTAQVDMESAFKLEKPDIKLPADILVWRGSPIGRQRQFARDLDAALIPFRQDNFAEAQRTLSALVNKYPASSDCYFYLGVAQLFLNQNADAAQTLQTALKDKPELMAADIPWYLAIALHRTGADVQIIQQLQPLCNEKGPYSQRACAAVEVLHQSKPAR